MIRNRDPVIQISFVILLKSCHLNVMLTFTEPETDITDPADVLMPVSPSLASR